MQGKSLDIFVVNSFGSGFQVSTSIWKLKISSVLFSLTLSYLRVFVFWFSVMDH